MPVCPHCQQDRSIRDYYFVEAKGRRYRRRKCKPCHQQTAQAWRRANAERVAAYNREYYADNAAYLREVNLEAWHARTRERKRAILAGIRRTDG